jgi:hypothetical protein
MHGLQRESKTINTVCTIPTYLLRMTGGTKWTARSMGQLTWKRELSGKLRSHGGDGACAKDLPIGKLMASFLLQPLDHGLRRSCFLFSSFLRLVTYILFPSFLSTLGFLPLKSFCKGVARVRNPYQTSTSAVDHAHSLYA